MPRDDPSPRTEKKRLPEPDKRDLEPFVAPPSILLPRHEVAPSAAPPMLTATRVAETQVLVERLVTSMRVGRSARGAEVHMTLEGARDTEVRVRELNGRLEVELRGDETSGLAARIENALLSRGLEADVRCAT